MSPWKLASALKRGFSVFNAKTSPGAKVLIAYAALCFGAIGVFVTQELIHEAWESYKLEHTSSAEHLAIAKEICKISAGNPSACVSIQMDDAIGHLKKIPPTAPEYAEASRILDLIRLQQRRIEITEANTRAAAETAKAAVNVRAAQLANQSEPQSREQMLRDIQGEVHDRFICSTSTESAPIMSFDNGHYWWQDDGRCAAIEQTKREAEQRMRETEQKAEQNQRDEDAQLSSYWPTTIRVDTDMDSFWLPDEERTCQTYPNDKGRVAAVACNASGSHRDHNIPVKFWGGLDRNTVSDWKCRRESDQFVCKAID